MAGCCGALTYNRDAGLPVLGCQACLPTGLRTTGGILPAGKVEAGKWRRERARDANGCISNAAVPRSQRLCQFCGQAAGEGRLALECTHYAAVRQAAYTIPVNPSSKATPLGV